VGYGQLAGIGVTTVAKTAWARGRFDARDGPRKLLFGHMYEDAAIEWGAFQPAGRVFCIASAGCTAMKLARRHDVVAVDINPVQLAYAERRFAGDPGRHGAAERVVGFARAFSPAVGWSRSRLRAFLDLDDPVAQTAYWRQHLDSWRFRTAFDGLFSLTALRAVYASPFLDLLPPRFGAVMRQRMARCFARYANRTNPYARALLLGEFAEEVPPSEAKSIRLVHADAAAYLESESAGSFDGFALSNILDGADVAYERRLIAALKRAAAPGAVTVLRSFREPSIDVPTNHAAEDRAMLWGIVDVRPAATL
jgi:S-adenosylmethionine:diacylglycerol 3-amino-3-carboxypropyl transferase